MVFSKITVLMSVYNGKKYLKEAINSILNQTFKNFDFLIINDGSIDDSEKIIKSYQDNRIKLVNNEKNLGLVNSLNIGFDLAQGDYVVRMDVDDISLPNRLAEQFDFMESHLDIGVCGTAIELFGSCLFNKIIKNPLMDEEIKASFLLENVIAHPSVIIRKEIYKNFKYDQNFKCIEDYELWIRISDKIKFANLNKVLLKYRLHNSQKSIVDNNLEKEEEKAKLLGLYFKKLFWSSKVEEILTDYRFFFHSPSTLSELDSLKVNLHQIIKFNESQPRFDNYILIKIVIRYWFKACFNLSLRLKGKTWRIFWDFIKELPKNQQPAINWWQQLKLELINLNNNFFSRIIIHSLFNFRNYLKEKIRVYKFYQTGFAQVTHQNCFLKLANKNILDIISIAFNNEKVIEYQIKLIRKNILNPYIYTVADNSSIPEKQAKIFALCQNYGVAYIRLPHNPLFGSLSHGLAINWVWKNYLKLRQPKYFGFIDHDIFPMRPLSVVSYLDKQNIYGLLQEKKKWYLWAGFCFFKFDYVKNKNVNFLPKIRLDTGGGNYKSIYRYLNKDNLFFPDEKLKKIQDGNISQSDYVSYIGDWIHTINASHWMKIDNQGEKEKIITDILDNLIKK